MNVYKVKIAELDVEIVSKRVIDTLTLVKGDIIIIPNEAIFCHGYCSAMAIVDENESYKIKISQGSLNDCVELK